MSFHISYARDFEKRFSFQYYEPLVLSNMAGTCDLFAHNIGRKNFFQNPCSRTVECHKRNIAANFLAFVVNDFLRGYLIKGAREVDFHIYIFSYRGDCQLPGTFFKMEKYCSYSNISHFQITKIHTLTIRMWTLSPPTFFEISA